MKMEVLANDSNMMQFCSRCQQWEGLCSEGLVTISKADFATAFCAAMVLGIDDTADRDMSEDELTHMAINVRQLFYAERWLSAPKEMGAKLTPAERIGAYGDETTDL